MRALRPEPIAKPARESGAVSFADGRNRLTPFLPNRLTPFLPLAAVGSQSSVK
jgi:hypothetical protein